MPRKQPRYTQKVSSISPNYNRALVLELLERQAQYVSHAARSNTTLDQTAMIVDIIMQRTTNGFDGAPYRMWTIPLRLSRNSNVGTFLANNFPKNHDIFDYVEVVGYSDVE